MVDVLYQNRSQEMSNFLEEDWLSPEPVCFDKSPTQHLPLPVCKRVHHLE